MTSPVAEEAAKLAEALLEWAKARGTPLGFFGSGLNGLGGHLGGSQECTLCPFCQLLALARTTSPEVFEHLAAAATSLLAAAGALADSRSGPAPRPPVQRIDLDLS